MLNLHQNYCRETFHQGRLVNFEAVYDDHFNFAYDVIDVLGEKEPDRRAMVWCDDFGHERTFTFGDISRYTNMAANVLAAQGIGKGDRVMLILKRHYQFWFILPALHKLGAVGIPATFLLKTHDFVERCNDAGVKALICTADGDTANQFDAGLGEYKSVTVRMTVNGEREGWLNFDKLFETASDKLERVETLVTDPMLLYFTSGTDSKPKMVIHDFAYPIAHIVTAKYWHHVDPDGLHLTLSDSGWMKSLWGKLYGQWFMEAGIFVCDFEKFDAKRLLPLFAQYHITTFCAPPTMFRYFILEDLSKYDLSSLQNACIAGEALSPEVFNKFREATGLSLLEGFGQTETTLTIFNQYGSVPKPGFMGKASPAYDVDLLDDDGKPVPSGVVGEVCVRIGAKKPCGLYNGYYKGGEFIPLSALAEDGLHHTGDIAWRDEEGYVKYVGRIDDVIKSSGYRISPAEVEGAMIKHPAVLECAATGYPDAIRGQIVKASIVLKPGYEPSDELVKDIQVFVKQNTAPYKYPRMVVFVDALPKTTNGKISRKQIRAADTGVKELETGDAVQ